MPLMQSLNPGRPIAADRVLSFADPDATNAWLRQNNQTERVLGGVHFSPRGACRLAKGAAPAAAGHWGRAQKGRGHAYHAQSVH